MTDTSTEALDALLKGPFTEVAYSAPDEDVETCKLVAATARALTAERDTLRRERDEARSAMFIYLGALRQIFARSSQARPAHYENTIMKVEEISESALKSEPAPRAVSVQEAAKVLLRNRRAIMYDIIQDKLIINDHGEIEGVASACDAALRALAQKEKGDV